MRFIVNYFKSPINRIYSY